jgi:fructokinase
MVQFFRGGLEEMLGDGVDILFANEAEAHAWTGQDTVNESIEMLKDIARVVVVTLGPKGALIYDGSRKILIDAVSVKAIDSNGAGDMFAGAFLYAISVGESLEFAGNLASLAAATTVCNFGPRLLPIQHQDILESGRKKFQK